jgi:hypothetical protein
MSGDRPAAGRSSEIRAQTGQDRAEQGFAGFLVEN